MTGVFEVNGVGCYYWECFNIFRRREAYMFIRWLEVEREPNTITTMVAVTYGGAKIKTSYRTTA